MYYSKDQIDRANAVNLEEFLCDHGERLKRCGSEMQWEAHDSVKIRGNKWHRFSNGTGGYPINFVMEFYGKSFPEAVEMLIGERGEEQREAVYLCYYEGYTVKEAAKIMGIKETKLRSALTAAKRMLRRKRDV